ncbi:uncharacterized protein Z518_08898 [Rhinocladiella mackenziei CBS 650.93]|uniref:Rhinocladiella mackenziei CBS 650.93 unplaced genomic scaffold supercont1.7, whole genome shotgun sequence n=1 Tax=Rhinocladiella mackenziei CBS 650.93 TaxID=1442369 RepID=A0A0D2GS70_9EURO|nr:uncharacterized protein Z518_08898 [Rhinocladiella mackenziei CBS 650.93]KIX01173.1 hypothetical protein Z518_08898 [Rhinocladiella mackenziei CBS 650.93]
MATAKSTRADASDYKNDFAPEIPSNAGKGPVTAKYAGATLKIYVTCAVLALASFVFDANPRLQHAGLGLLIPGGSFLGVGGFWLLGFPVTMALFALSSFLWFATGNTVAPFLTWPGLALIMAASPIAAERTPYSVFITPLLATVAYRFIVHFGNKDAAAALENRQKRNSYLPAVVQQLARDAVAPASPEDMELQPEELGQLRYFIEVANQDKDDWSNFTEIEQFQTSALRYQLNELSYALSFANKLYTPSFRGGYLQEAQKNVLLKYCQKKVLNYWKWETLWGRLSTDYHPYNVDNIMLTGFYLLALAMYEGATGDDCFSKANALHLPIDDTHIFKASSTSLAAALINNFRNSDYCLYACEPNWIYTFCNLQGLNALVANDSNKGTSDAEKIKEQFRQSFIEDFMAADGSVHPIRSYLTGLRIPGLVGAANDFSVSCLSGAIFPDISIRSYAISRKEYTEIDEKDNLVFKGLQGADLMDPGNYQASKATLYATSLLAAREHGDKVAADSVLKLIDFCKEFKRIEKDGVIWYDKVSLLMKGQLFRGRINTTKGWFRAITEPLSDAIKKGPYLCEAKYPEVLVAKAISHTGTDLELVLYPGTKKRDVSLQLKELISNTTYVMGEKGQFNSDALGQAVISVTLDGRTRLHITKL